MWKASIYTHIFIYLNIEFKERELKYNFNFNFQSEIRNLSYILIIFP